MTIGRPAEEEAASVYFTYIDKAPGDDPQAVIRAQLDEAAAFLSGISEERSLHRYAPEKWSIRETLNHISDTERAFTFRALWFARGFDAPLPGYDQNVAVSSAGADSISWAAHMNEFRHVRLATISFLENLPPEAWMRTGFANGNPFTVRAVAFIIAGHLKHHMDILQERYL